jgi:hypothetical protein
MGSPPRLPLSPPKLGLQINGRLTGAFFHLPTAPPKDCFIGNTVQTGTRECKKFSGDSIPYFFFWSLLKTCELDIIWSKDMIKTERKVCIHVTGWWIAQGMYYAFQKLESRNYFKPRGQNHGFLPTWTKTDKIRDLGFKRVKAKEPWDSFLWKVYQNRGYQWSNR